MARDLAVLSLGMILTGPAWAAAPQKPTGSARDPKTQVSQIEGAPGTLEALGPPGVVLVGSPGFIAEVEPNDTIATAQPLASTPVRVRGDLYRVPFVPGEAEVDVYSFTAAAGDRVYAATMTSFSGGRSDTLIDLIDVEGIVLETDDDDGAGVASNIGGRLLASGGTYFVRVRQFQPTSLENTVRPYDLYVRVLSGAPAVETEPNTPPGAPANPLPANGWVSGAMGHAFDNDTFSLTANAGDTIVAILDADPERDSPDWNPRLGIGLFNNSYGVVNGSGVGGPFDDANPSEALFMTVRTAGTYLIFVDPVIEGSGAPANTYTLSVSVIPATPRRCTAYPGTTGPINDLSTNDFTVAIPELRTIDTLQLFLNATHTAIGDLDVSLLSPDGNEVVLFNDPNQSLPPAPAPEIDLTLDDEAAVPIPFFSIHSDMRQAPDPFARLAYFQGMQAQGTWTLRVRDDAEVDIGTVNSWSLNVCESRRPACIDPGPAESTVFSTDFETGDAGFTHSGVQDEWQRGLPSFAPITTAHSGSNAFKTDLDNTYNPNANFDLLSPSIDLTGVTGRVTLSWWQKYQFETADFDTYWVDVRQVGLPSSARRLFAWKGATQTRNVGVFPKETVQVSAGWGLVQADISDFAGLNAEVRFHARTNGTVQLAGVAIDDVLVTSCATTDLIFRDGFE